MVFFSTLEKFREKQQRKKARAAGISEAGYQKYQAEKKKKLFRLEQSLKRKREEKALKEKYSQPATSFGGVIREAKKRISGGRTILTGRKISKGPTLGLVRDPLASDSPNPWVSVPKKKKYNPWID